MWKSIKEKTPRGNINVIITDRFGGFCFVRTMHNGDLPPHRYMMKIHNDHYYTARKSITKWMEVSALRDLLSPDTLEKP